MLLRSFHIVQLRLSGVLAEKVYLEQYGLACINSAPFYTLHITT